MISKKGADIQVLINKLENLVDVQSLDQDFLRLFTDSISKIISMYNYFDKKYPQDYFFNKNSDTTTFKFTSRIPIQNNYDGLGKMLATVTNGRYSNIGIDYFIRKIELIEKVSD